MVPDLLSRFSTKEGYSLYPDVMPFLQRLRENTGQSRQTHPQRELETNDDHLQSRWDNIVVGVITNSDDRIPSILRSFGLNVSPRRSNSCEEIAPNDLAADIHFVVLSYDVGHEKPDPRIFGAAEVLMAAMLKKKPKASQVFEKLYVGDDFEKDFIGARDAGWRSVLLDRKGTPRHNVICTLDDLPRWARYSDKNLDEEMSERS